MGTNNACCWSEVQALEHEDILQRLYCALSLSIMPRECVICVFWEWNSTGGSWNLLCSLLKNRSRNNRVKLTSKFRKMRWKRSISIMSKTSFLFYLDLASLPLCMAMLLNNYLVYVLWIMAWQFKDWLGKYVYKC